jgi:hypothetical protein
LIVSNTNPNTCVHVIDGKNPELIKNEEPIIKLSASFSNIDQIMTDRKVDLPPKNPFGNEPNHTWCYYYQKAQLARQKLDWQEVVDLMEKAKKLGFSPNDKSELLPFIEGYLMIGNIETTSNYLQKIENDKVLINNFCKTFEYKNNLQDFQKEFYNSQCEFQ